MDKEIEQFIIEMKQAVPPEDLSEKILENIRYQKQIAQGERCLELEGIDDFCIDDYRDPSAVVWRRQNGFGVDYYWSVDHFAEICNLAIKSGQSVTVCDNGIDIVVINSGTKRASHS